MKKKIKSLKRYNQNYRNFNFSDLTSHADEEFVDMEVLFDDDGNIIEEIKYDSTGEIEEKNSYTFNSNGKLLTHTLLYALDDATEKRVLTRNEKGLLISEIKYYGDDTGEKTEYEYDEKDNVTAIIRYDEEGLLISREEIKYDEKGNINDRTTFNQDKVILSKITFSLSENNQVEENEFDEKGVLVSKTLLKFNENGKELSSLQTTPQGKLIASVQNTYDERGNIIEKIYKDFYSKTLKYSYNEKDNLTIQELYDDNGLLLRKNMFEYDEDGNVVAEQTYEMDTSRGGRDKHFGTRYEYFF